MKIKKIKKITLSENEIKIELCDLAMRMYELTEDLGSTALARKVTGLALSKDINEIEEIREELVTKEAMENMY